MITSLTSLWHFCSISDNSALRVHSFSLTGVANCLFFSGPRMNCLTSLSIRNNALVRSGDSSEMTISRAVNRRRFSGMRLLSSIVFGASARTRNGGQHKASFARGRCERGSAKLQFKRQKTTNVKPPSTCGKSSCGRQSTVPRGGGVRKRYDGRETRSVKRRIIDDAFELPLAPGLVPSSSLTLVLSATPH